MKFFVPAVVCAEYNCLKGGGGYAENVHIRNLFFLHIEYLVEVLIIEVEWLAGLLRVLEAQG